MNIRRLQDNDYHKLEPLLSENIETSMCKSHHGDYFAAFDNKDNIIGVIEHHE